MTPEELAAIKERQANRQGLRWFGMPPPTSIFPQVTTVDDALLPDIDALIAEVERLTRVAETPPECPDPDRVNY